MINIEYRMGIAVDPNKTTLSQLNTTMERIAGTGKKVHYDGDKKIPVGASTIYIA